MRQIVVVALLAVALPATAAAQWDISEEVDPFTDESTFRAYLLSEENKLLMSYSCTSDGTEIVLVAMSFGVDTDLFADGRVQIRFDDDTAERTEWTDNDEYLLPPPAFVQRMAQPQHQTLLLGVTAFPSDRVADQFDLTGTAAMLEQTDCRAE